MKFKNQIYMMKLMPFIIIALRETNEYTRVNEPNNDNTEIFLKFIRVK